MQRYQPGSQICIRMSFCRHRAASTRITCSIHPIIAAIIADFNIAGLQYSLPATWNGALARGMGPELLARWWSEAPAKLAGLHGRKGRLAAGFDADLVVRARPIFEMYSAHSVARILSGTAHVTCVMACEGTSHQPVSTCLAVHQLAFLRLSRGCYLRESQALPLK